MGQFFWETDFFLSELMAVQAGKVYSFADYEATDSKNVPPTFAVKISARTAFTFGIFQLLSGSAQNTLSK